MSGDCVIPMLSMSVFGFSGFCGCLGVLYTLFVCLVGLWCLLLLGCAVHPVGCLGCVVIALFWLLVVCPVLRVLFLFLGLCCSHAGHEYLWSFRVFVVVWVFCTPCWFVGWVVVTLF